MIENAHSPIQKGPNRGRPAEGTITGYQRHQKFGEESCAPCREAWLDYGRNYYHSDLENQRARRRASDFTSWRKDLEWSRMRADKRYRNRKDYLERARFLGMHTQREMDLLREYYKGRCAYCGSLDPLETDHMIPLSRIELNPTDAISNISLVCRMCNQSKGRLTLEEWDPMLAESVRIDRTMIGL